MVKRVFNISLATYMLKKLALLCIYFSKLSAYRTNFDETKYMSFLMKDDELLEKYNEIWEKVKNSIKRKVDCEPVYNEIYLKGKKKNIIMEKLTQVFTITKSQKKVPQFICLSVILIDFVLRQVKTVILKHFQKNVNMLPK